ncbi:hypothetical protein ACFQDG_06085 [Natronoarchaeum mannanilyticum]|uniref:KaiC-like domain-containing protein n=1 Tax=Natronoarchaeum mannanilyticum TaxID=926360 RepID=A0AAV3T6G2_9EURY
MSDELIDVSGGANVLVLGESGRNADRCCDALLDVGRAERRGELTVSFPEDVSDRTRLDTGATGRQSAKLGHITVGDVLRSADHSPPDFAEPVATDIVEDPGDLKAIGTSVSRFCESWAESGHLMVLCFDSISELLDRRDPKVVFQFLHTLLERLSSVDTVAHFHLDPDRFDEQTVSTFASLFDEVIDPATAEDLVDESGLDDADTEDDGGEDDAEDADGGPSLSDGIPATSGSSQASDDEIAARLDDHVEEYEVADGGTATGSASRQASDDDIAERIPDVGEEPEDGDPSDGAGEADADDAGDADTEGAADTENEDDERGAEDDANDGGSDAIAGADDETDIDDLEFDFG